MGGIRYAGLETPNRNRMCQRDVGPRGARTLCPNVAHARLVNVLGQPDVCKSCYEEIKTDVDPAVRAWCLGAVFYPLAPNNLPPGPRAA